MERMESFTTKVGYSNGSRSDPLLEEKGGWIVGEAHGQDADMMEAMIEVVAKANNHTVKLFSTHSRNNTMRLSSWMLRQTSMGF